MNNIILKISFFVFIISLTFLIGKDTFAQNDTAGSFQFRAYILTLNKDYYIYTLDDEIIYGKIVGFNRNEIHTNTEDGLIAVKKDNIRTITTDYPNVKIIPRNFSITKYKTVWSFGGGIVYPQGNSRFSGSHNTKSAGDYKKGFSICASGITPFSRYAAIKTELDFSHFPNGDNYYIDTWGNNSYSTYQSGGTINDVSFKGGIGFGNFATEGRIIFNIFFSLGAGMEYKAATTFYETMTGTYPYNNVFHNDSFSQFILCGCLSSSINIILKKNFGIFIEPQINMYSSANASGQISLKSGIFF
ncbi:MAG: hypothetical protein PHN88_07105 [Ignavibacteria bacterium]|nr:hypothetical protein [Ignavibacteria bacterium]